MLAVGVAVDVVWAGLGHRFVNYIIVQDLRSSDNKLAKRLDLSPEALSERLRRAHEDLTKNTIIIRRDAEGNRHRP